MKITTILQTMAMARKGKVMQDKAWHGVERQGMERYDMEWQGKACHDMESEENTWHVMERKCMA
jgi:hypothetical protein